MHSSDCKVLLKPPADWKTVFQDSSMLHSFFDVSALLGICLFKAWILYERILPLSNT